MTKVFSLIQKSIFFLLFLIIFNLIFILDRSNNIAYSITIDQANSEIAEYLTGDDNQDGIVSESEVQSAVNQFFLRENPQECNDKNMDGIISINELQLIINNHLKLNNENNIQITHASFHYRTYADGSTAYRGYCDFTKNGNLIEESDVKSITLKDEAGNVIPISEISFYSNPDNGTYTASYNREESELVVQDETIKESGFSLKFDEATSIPEGIYTFEVETDDGVLTQEYYFGGELVMPFHDSNYTDWIWNNDDTLTLTWKNPEGSYDQVKLSIWDDNGNDVFYVFLPPEVESLTLSSELLDKISDNFLDPKYIYIDIQTRKNLNGLNYARGISGEHKIHFIYKDEDSLSFSGAYLQQRTYENGYKEYRGLCILKNGEDEIVEQDIKSISLKDSSGNNIELKEAVFYTEDPGYFRGEYNSEDASIVFNEGLLNESGFMIKFYESLSLAEGYYTYVVNTFTGKQIEYDVYFGGETDMPFHILDNIEWYWNSDETLTINWNNPDGQYDEIRLAFGDQSHYIMDILLPPDKESITLDINALNKIASFNSEELWFNIQTRKNENGFNYARGISNEGKINFWWYFDDDKIHFENASLNFRTYEDGSTQYRGWCDFKNGNDLVGEDEFKSIVLRDSSGSEIETKEIDFYNPELGYYWCEYNNVESRIEYNDSLVQESGYSIKFDDSLSLSQGYYTYIAETYNDVKIAYTLYFDGEKIMPVVNSGSIHLVGNEDGSSSISWVNPEGDFDKLVVWIYDQDWDDVMGIEVSPETNTIMFDSEFNMKVYNSHAPQSLKIVISTRNYQNGYNYARGYSNAVDYP